MTPQDFAAFLDRTLEDRKLSRNERRALTEVVADDATLAQYRSLAFSRAAATIGQAQAGLVLEWLEDVLKALQPKPPAAQATHAEAYFSPGEECCRRLVGLLGSARKSLDVCVFTITDDRITRALLDAHRRRVAMRIITDNEKATDLGSDIAEIERAGIPLRIDRTPFHMHHKFAIVDGSLLLNGSFNWTRSASANNQENFVITGDPRLVASFTREFERLWSHFGP
jgi:phosphatidylserine/phosphatidylglycerophosphate/cardiolipin synthase-like enzyme